MLSLRGPQLSTRTYKARARKQFTRAVTRLALRSVVGQRTLQNAPKHLKKGAPYRRAAVAIEQRVRRIAEYKRR